MRQEAGIEQPTHSDLTTDKDVGREIKKLRKVGQIEQAIVVGERWLSHHTDAQSIRTLTSLAATHIKKRDFSSAEGLCQRVLAVNLRNEVALTCLGQSALNQGNYEAAEDWFQKTLATSIRAMRWRTFCWRVWRLHMAMMTAPMDMRTKHFGINYLYRHSES